MNQIQGDENYALMVKNRRLAKQAKADEVAEFKAKYQIDLMARLSQRGQKHDMERRNLMANK